MVSAALSDIARYRGAVPAFDKVAEFLSKDLSSLPDGRYDIDGDKLYASLASYETKDASEALFETHRKYIDIQIVLDGEEICGVAPADEVTEIALPYEEEKDVAFFDAPDAVSAAIPLRKGLFAVFFPEDAHMPGLSGDAKSCVRKCVIKVVCDL